MLTFRFDKNEIARFLLMLLSVFCTLVLVEGFLRIFPSLLPEEAQLRLHWREMVSVGTKIVAHPYIGYLYPPHFRGMTCRGDFSFNYQTDGHGFRNPWPWPAQAEIVAVGDSMTFGYGVDDNLAWTAVLAQKLPHSRVINLGLIGSGPQQYLRIYETFGINLHPKVLLFGLFNDVLDARNFDLWLKAGEVGNYRFWLSSRREKGVRKYLARSYLYTFLTEAWGTFRSLDRFRGKTIQLPDRGRLQLAPGILAHSTRRARRGHPDFQLVVETVERAHALTQRNGTQLLILFFPSKEEVYLPVLGEPTPDSIGPFRAEFENRGIRYLDLSPAFRERAAAGETLFFEVDGHPNARGYALIADIVLSHLKHNARAYGLTGEYSPAGS